MCQEESGALHAGDHAGGEFSIPKATSVFAGDHLLIAANSEKNVSERSDQVERSEVIAADLSQFKLFSQIYEITPVKAQRLEKR
jgi:hypothetical protein